MFVLAAGQDFGKIVYVHVHVCIGLRSLFIYSYIYRTVPEEYIYT